MQCFAILITIGYWHISRYFHDVRRRDTIYDMINVSISKIQISMFSFSLNTWQTSRVRDTQTQPKLSMLGVATSYVITALLITCCIIFLRCTTEVILWKNFTLIHSNDM